MTAAVPPTLAHSFPDRTTLTPRDRIVLRAVAEAMFAQDGEVSAARLDAHVCEVDAFISAASKPLRVGLRIALFVVSIAPLLLFFRLRRIDKLTIDDRVHVLARLERSSITNLSLAFIGWRTVMTLVFYENPVELQRLGYAGDERQVYKRRLPTLVAVAPVAAIAPPAEESGVRLRGDTPENADAEDADSVQNKVA